MEIFPPAVYSDAYLIFDTMKEDFTIQRGNTAAWSYFHDVLDGLKLYCGGTKDLVITMNKLFGPVEGTSSEKDWSITYRMGDAENLYNFIKAYSYKMPEETEES